MKKSSGYLDLGDAKLDLEREKRCGAAEVIFGLGKTDKQIFDLIEAQLKSKQSVLITKVRSSLQKKIKKLYSQALISEKASLVAIHFSPLKITKNDPVITVCAAGTSDIPVAEEAALTASFYRNQVHRVYDVGVAGIHRLLAHQHIFEQSHVIIAVAGMEGALPSVITGLVKAPVIAVPTSIGYGAHFEGVTPLLAMVNSCASGLTVVNIDNGFGAGFAAARMTNLLRTSSSPNKKKPKKTKK